MLNFRIKIAFKIINLAIKIMPEEYRNITFIKNCMLTNMIKVDRS